MSCDLISFSFRDYFLPINRISSYRFSNLSVASPCHFTWKLCTLIMNKPEATVARKSLTEETRALLGDAGDTVRLEIIPVCRKDTVACVYRMLQISRLGILGWAQYNQHEYRIPEIFILKKMTPKWHHRVKIHCSLKSGVKRISIWLS